MSRTAEEIKDKIKMDDILSRYSIERNRNGFICCPFHGEKTASCKIYPDGFYCFGCGVGGDVIAFVKKLFSVDFREAIKRMENDFGITISNTDDEEPLFVRRQKERRKRARILQEKYSSLCKEYRALNAISDGLTDEQVARVEYLEYALEETRKEMGRDGA